MSCLSKGQVLSKMARGKKGTFERLERVNGDQWDVPENFERGLKRTMTATDGSNLRSVYTGNSLASSYMNQHQRIIWDQPR
jgi:hypothetical protein